jgi:hypothetical protein
LGFSIDGSNLLNNWLWLLLTSASSSVRFSFNWSSFDWGGFNWGNFWSWLVDFWGWLSHSLASALLAALALTSTTSVGFGFNSFNWCWWLDLEASVLETTASSSVRFGFNWSSFDWSGFNWGNFWGWLVDFWGWLWLSHSLTSALLATLALTSTTSVGFGFNGSSFNWGSFYWSYFWSWLVNFWGWLSHSLASALLAAFALTTTTSVRFGFNSSDFGWLFSNDWDWFWLWLWLTHLLTSALLATSNLTGLLTTSSACVSESD